MPDFPPLPLGVALCPDPGPGEPGQYKGLILRCDDRPDGHRRVESRANPGWYRSALEPKADGFGSGVAQTSLDGWQR